jgi:hypothetical protein
VPEARTRTLRGIGQRTPAVESLKFVTPEVVNLVALFVLDRSMLSLPMDVLRHDEHGESDERGAKARKDIDKHCVVGEHGASPPRITLSPWME